MAESPQGLHDSRFSGSGPHTTTRGASAPAVLGDLAAAERHPEFSSVPNFRGSIGDHPMGGSSSRERQPPGRNGLPLVLSVHVQPCGTDERSHVQRLHRLPDAFSSAGRSGAPIVALLGGILSWGMSSSTLLRTKHCDLACSLPPFLPPGTRGVLVPRAPDRGLGLVGLTKIQHELNTEKHLWLDSL